jgi:hypothetical protein
MRYCGAILVSKFLFADLVRSIARICAIHQSRILNYFDHWSFKYHPITIDLHRFPQRSPWQHWSKIGQNQGSRSGYRFKIIPCIEHLKTINSYRRKRSLSDYQKQIRLLTVISVFVVLAVFAGLIYLINR